MTDSVRTHANERLDLPDAIAIAATFPREQQKEVLLRYLLMDRPGSRVMDGFRLQVDVATPGQFTLYNGVAVNRDGQIVLDDESAIKSKTYVLQNALTTYYVMVRWRLDDADVDARAFMDPTFNNGADPSGDLRPNGREFTLGLPTRQHPAWEIVVNTVAFPYLSDQTTVVAGVGQRSLEIPIATLTTDAGGNIAGVTLESPRSTITDITNIAADWVEVNTVRQFAVGDNVQVANNTTGAVVGPYPVATVNYENSSIEATGINASGAQVGWGLQSTAVGDLLVLNTAADSTIRSWAQRTTADFLASRALLQDPDAPAATTTAYANGNVLEIPTARTPEHIYDRGSFERALLSVLREMKFGSVAAIANGTRWCDELQTGTLSEVYQSRIEQGQVPTYLTTLQGRVQGNKGYLTTVGNGVTTFGDWNGQGGFEDLIDYLNAQELLGTAFTGRILIKEGTYNLVAWGATKRLPNGVIFEGTDRAGVIITNAPTFNITQGAVAWIPHDMGFKNMTITTQAAAGTGLLPLLYCNAEEMTDLIVEDCTLSAGGFDGANRFGAINLDGFGAAIRARGITVRGCTFTMQEGGYGCRFEANTSIIEVDDCTFNWDGLGLVLTGSGVYSIGTNFFTSAYDYVYKNNKFLGVPTGFVPLRGQANIQHTNSAGIFFRDNRFDATPTNGTGIATNVRLLRIPIAASTGLYLSVGEGEVSVENCYFGSFEIAANVANGVASFKDNVFDTNGIGLILDATAVAAPAVGPSSYFVSGNRFINVGHISALFTQLGSVGIVLVAAANVARSTLVDISDNHFEGQTVAIYGQGAGAGNYDGAFKDINIVGNKFHDVLSSAVYCEDGWTGDTATGNANAYAVENLNITANKFTRCSLNPLAAHFANAAYVSTAGYISSGVVIKYAAAHCNVSSNDYYECYRIPANRSTVDEALVVSNNRAESFRFCDNKVFDCWPLSEAADYVYLDIGMGYNLNGGSPLNTPVDVDIQNNTFTHTPLDEPTGFALTPIVQGIRVYPAMDWNHGGTSQMRQGYIVRGNVCNNRMDIVNTPYALQVAHVDPSAQNSMKIGELNFSGNQILDWIDSRIGAPTPSINLIVGYAYGEGLSADLPIDWEQRNGYGITFIGNRLRVYIDSGLAPGLDFSDTYALRLYTYPPTLVCKDNVFTNCLVRLDSLIVDATYQGEFDHQFDLDISQNHWDIDNGDIAIPATIRCLWFATVTQLFNNTVAWAPDDTHRNHVKVNDNTFRVRNHGVTPALSQRAVYINGIDALDLPNVVNAASHFQMRGNSLMYCRNQWNGAAVNNPDSTSEWRQTVEDFHANYSHNQMEMAVGGVAGGTAYSHWADIDGGAAVVLPIDYAYTVVGGLNPSPLLICVGNTNDVGVIDSLTVGHGGPGNGM